jgi:Uma2 family endonuclease
VTPREQVEAFEKAARTRRFGVEVAPPFTEGVDRREKRFNYAQIPSLQEYILVSQDTHRVEVLRREADWLGEVVEDGGTVEFRSIGLNLPVAAIYEDIVT